MDSRLALKSGGPDECGEIYMSYNVCNVAVGEGFSDCLSFISGPG